MRNSFLALTMTALTLALMLVGVPAAAQQASQSGQSGARVQVKASARIISGETVRFGTTTQKIATKRRESGNNIQIFPLARTRGEINLDGQPYVLVTEFH